MFGPETRTGILNLLPLVVLDRLSDGDTLFLLVAQGSALHPLPILVRNEDHTFPQYSTKHVD